MSESELPRIPVGDLKTFSGRAKHLYSIQEKSGALVNFNLLESQEYLDEIVEEEYDRTKRETGTAQCRLIILKSRQVGLTTYSCIRSLDQQIHDEGAHGAIMAHDLDTTDIVYDMYKRAYENLPEYVVPTKDGEDMTKRAFFKHSLSDTQISKLGLDLSKKEFDNVHKVKIKPETKSFSGKRLAFKDTNSRTTIATAGKGDAGGKGVTLRRIVLSESANFGKYSSLLTSINPSVPKFADNVFFIIESTANGTTGDGEGFYNAWEKATKEWEKYKQGKVQSYSGFRPVFIPWYMIEEYEYPLIGGKLENIDEVDFGSPEIKQNFLEREKTLLEDGIYNPLTCQKEKITKEKINWYRWIIKKDCEYDYRKAQRYYPTTPEEAFVASSHCFFDSMKLNEVKNKYLNDGEPEKETGDLVWGKESGELEFKPSSVGDLTIWEKPDPKWENRYCIGIDIGRGHKDGDYSVAHVKDRLEQKIVARWYGKTDQDIFAEIVSELGLYYNEALLVPESNLDTVVELIKPSGHTPYVGELYYTESGNSVKWGYWTSGGNRQILIDRYKAHLRDNRDGYEYLPDTETIDEHISFVRRQTAHGVKYEADEGSHDDRVLSLALCEEGDRWMSEQGLDPDKFTSEKIKEIIAKPMSRAKKFARNAKIGRKK